MKDPHLTAFHQPKTEGPDSHPEHIGRFRIERLLGKGGFGVVYLAHDDQLQRLVAVKVPHHDRVSTPAGAEACLTEARTVANLDHPNIVPVFDVGSTVQFPCYVVSKYIDGMDLATRLEQSQLSLHDAVELVATVADALHHAHKQGLVHRDIKPGNILLDRSGQPFVGDFGLALREQDLGMGPRYAGTLAFMSPEQARGEGHRVDGRSDIFSLGIVFYKMLTGHLPFHAQTQNELADQLASMEVRPPRQWVDTIPREIERICLKALAKRASDRYSTAKDLANDLRHFLILVPRPTSGAMPDGIGALSLSALALRAQSGSLSTIARIVPKGLRSFDNHDADFFLELVPGPRDRDGLPDSIRFWKTRIEETDEDKSFAVGLIYGPSGCGKSSLVKAGLLPRLSKDVIAIYVEATAQETEVRLVGGLRKLLQTAPPDLKLKDALAAIRLGEGALPGAKVLIVLDQFEQWLHAQKEQRHTELVEALRQCDGKRLQCIVMVRDDFWLAVSRFLKELEIPLLEGHNSALVDLFDTDHARKVLAAFGRAFGKLPNDASALSAEHKKFLDLAVADLAPEGKVICVRLALFADMMKGKTWTPASLKAVGGTAGVRVTFLEETFSAATAPPQHRLHQPAARAVLRELLPEAGTDLKGHMRSYGELLEASGYQYRPGDFGDLLRILDSEIRLITPTDPDGKQAGGNASGDPNAADASPSPSARYYQLTHDYLVPSLRDWLTRKKKESRHGRAELLLEDLASVWTMRPEYRQLPSLLQWLQILRLTRPKAWTAPQRLMMTTATRYHAARTLLAVMLVAIMSWAGLEFAASQREQNHAKHAEALVGRLLVAKTAKVPGIITEINACRHWANPLLKEANARALPGSAQKLHISLALLPEDEGQIGFLFERLLEAEPQEVPVVCDALARAPGRVGLTDQLWQVLRQPTKGKEGQRLRAAAALAAWDAKSAQWAAASSQVASDLVQVPTVHLETWLDCLSPVAGSLLSPLATVSQDGKRPDTERHLATDVLAVYAKNDVNRLADLLMDADETQFAAVFPAFQAHGAAGVAVLRDVIAEMPAEADDAKERLAKRQANAAVALVRMKHAEVVWPLLKFRQDPRVRSYIIHRFAPMGAAAATIVEQLQREPEVSTHRALILSLGEYDKGVWSGSERGQLIERMRDIYQTAADPGLHAAAEWLLRSWSQNKWLDDVDAQWAKDGDKRDAALQGIAKQLASGSAPRPAGWYVTGQRHTMVVIPGPTVFLMGSPITEADREDGPTSSTEAQHRKGIKRSFAIAAKEVTVEQFQRFHRDVFQSDYRELDGEFSPHPDCPVNRVSWYLAARYCNWLSQQEGILPNQWYYEKNADGKYDAGMKSVPGRTGYRLPTEAEWECACRAGTSTSRYFGETEELLPKYAWYSKNAQDRGMLPGKPTRFGELGLTLKPNDYGLFGMLGNALEWCHSKLEPYRDGDDTEFQEQIDTTTPRMLRGGSFNYLPGSVRAAYRVWRPPWWPMDNAGFRPARTINPRQ